MPTLLAGLLRNTLYGALQPWSVTLCRKQRQGFLIMQVNLFDDVAPHE